MSREKLFIDMRPGARTKGLVTFNDLAAIDEIKSISFTDDKEMARIFKGYMEDGFVNIGGNRVDGEAGIIFFGNIDLTWMIEEICFVNFRIYSGTMPLFQGNISQHFRLICINHGRK